MPGAVTWVVVMLGVSKESREGGCGEGWESDLTSVSFPGLKYLSWIQAPPPRTRKVNVIAHKDNAFLGSLAGEDGEVETGRGWGGLDRYSHARG